MRKAYYILSCCLLFIYSCGSDKKREIKRSPLSEIPTPPPSEDLPGGRPPLDKPPLSEIPVISLPSLPDFEDPIVEPEQRTCVSPRADMTRDGGYPVRQRMIGLISVYEPTVSGCLMPVYSHSNGTGARSIFYRTQMKRFASHGYLSVAYETTQSGSGLQQMRAVDWALTRRDTAPMLVAAGHSQGGSSAMVVHYLAQRKYGDSIKIVSIMEQPAWGMNRPMWRREIGQIRGSSFIINGTADTLVSRPWVASGVRLLRNDHSWYQANGATHFNVQPWAASGGLIYSNCKLLDYQNACRQFDITMPMSRYWTVVKK